MEQLFVLYYTMIYPKGFWCSTTHLATTPSAKGKTWSHKINSLSGTTLTEQILREMGERRLKHYSSVVEFLFRPSRPPWEITSSCLAGCLWRRLSLITLPQFNQWRKASLARKTRRSLDTVFLLLIFGGSGIRLVFLTPTLFYILQSHFYNSLSRWF